MSFENPYIKPVASDRHRTTFVPFKNINHFNAHNIRLNVVFLLSSPSFPVSAVVVPDGASERAGLGDELGSEEDLLYEEFRSSGHRFGHPGGGGGEQLAINEVGLSHRVSPGLLI